MLVGLAPIARAGECDVSGATSEVKELEKLAKNGKGDIPLGENMICVRDVVAVTPKLKARWLAACATIL
jgi:hypothetical protein